MLSYEIKVEEKVIKNTLYYKNTAVLTYTIRYPRFISNMFQSFLMKINNYYRERALIFENNHIQQLYELAKEQYDYAEENKFPFHPYEVIVEYHVTYNQNCFLSLYTDFFQYTGGAHGMTNRISETWDLTNGRKAILMDFFEMDHVQEFIIGNIVNQIEKEISSGKYPFNPYFEDYKTLVAEYFNQDSFYLDNEGVVIFFGLYEIAPFSSGIRTFTIPYTTKGVIPPRCSR